MSINIVLLEPENPLNTGALGRTCSVSGAKLHLIKPLGFYIDDKSIKKAGMDYWKELDVQYYDSFSDFLEKNNNPQIYMGTTKALYTYADVTYPEECFIMFGKESKGIPEEILVDYKDTCIRIPMIKDKRSINLATSASIILYEALRQRNFEGLDLTGELHNGSWGEV